jgi:hypothetical protein
MSGLEQAVVAPLRQLFGLLLVNMEPALVHDTLEPQLENLGETLSRDHSDVAFVATEYFGGIGMQAAAAWRRGEWLMLYSCAEQGVINRALALIGVRPGMGRDLFEEIGLGRYRSNEDWIEYATFGKASWER